MSSVRDSYRSRDYHKGTGSRVFLTENPGCYTFSLFMLVYCKFMIMLRFYLFHHDLSLIIGYGYVTQCCLNKDTIFHHAYVIHSAVPCLHVLLVPE
jgi:hypothetical protein